MATKSYGYDHRYIPFLLFIAGTVLPVPNGVTQKFAAYTAMKIKQVVHKRFWL